MNQHQPQDYPPSQWRPMVERIRNLLDRQTGDLHYWLNNPDDLPTLRLIWWHYRERWSSLIDQQQEPLLLDFCRRQAEHASRELSAWYLNVEGAVSKSTLSVELSKLLPCVKQVPVSKKGRGNHPPDP